MTFNEVNEILRLKNTPDWGIINADADRVEEFIEFLKQNPELAKSIKLEFTELIIASMNESILQKKHTKDTVRVFFKYVQQLRKDDFFQIPLEYWKSLKSNKEFPVSKLLIEET